MARGHQDHEAAWRTGARDDQNGSHELPFLVPEIEIDHAFELSPPGSCKNSTRRRSSASSPGRCSLVDHVPAPSKLERLATRREHAGCIGEVLPVYEQLLYLWLSGVLHGSSSPSLSRWIWRNAPKMPTAEHSADSRRLVERPRVLVATTLAL
jgi:hypothetical protein